VMGIFFMEDCIWNSGTEGGFLTACIEWTEWFLERVLIILNTAIEH
jgi:hypothetical protein